MRVLLSFFLILSFTVYAEQKLTNLSIVDKSNRSIKNCIPGGNFSFTATGFKPSQSTRYDVIMSTKEMITAKRINTIKASTVNVQKITFNCPKVKETFSAYLKPSSSRNLNYSPKVVFAGGLIPQLASVGMLNGQLEVTSLHSHNKLMLNIGSGKTLPISIRAKSPTLFRIPNEFTHGYIWLSNNFGESAHRYVFAEKEIPVLLSQLNIKEDELLTYHSKEDLLIEFPKYRKTLVQAGKINKISVYRVSRDDQPIIAGTSYYVGDTLVINPTTTAASKIFDALDLKDITLQDKMSIFRYLVKSRDTQRLASRYQEVSRLPTDIFTDPRSVELVTLAKDRLRDKVESLRVSELSSNLRGNN
jgi:hypothetical protein